MRRFSLCLTALFGAILPGGAFAYDICADPGGLPAGTVINQREMVRPEGTRWFCVVVPPGYTSTVDYPTVIVLHGGSGNPQTILKSSTRIAATGLSANSGAGYVMVFPTGSPNPDNCTDPTTPCADNGWSPEENIDFLNDLILYADSFNLDRNRLFLAGFSGGAQLIYRAIEADRLALPVKAVATAAGSLGNLKLADLAAGLEVVNITTGTPVNAMLFHGGADPKMAYDGGLSDGDTEIHLNYRLKIDMFRVLTDTVGVAGTAYPIGGAAFGTRWTGPTHSLIALSESNEKHQWPGDYSPHVFSFFDSF